MSIDEVRALVAERQRYDEWLSALEARRAETPERVFTRVHGDYAQRRGEVLARLHTHVDALSVLGGELSERLAGLDRELESLEDQRVEAMLRTAVGEYDTQRADTLREDVESQLARLTDERGSVHMELDDIRALLDQAAPARHATPVSVVADIAPVAPTPVEAAIAEPVPSAPVVEALADEPPAPHSDAALPVDSTPVSIFGDVSGVDAAEEREPLHEVVHQDAHTHTFDVAFDAAPEIPQFVDNRVTPIDTAQVDDALRLFAETPAHPTAVVTPLLDPVEFTTPQVPPVPPAAAHVGAPEASPADPFDDLAFLRSVTEPEGGMPPAARAPAIVTAPSTPVSADAPQKTLRCTECGTMNLPTEWYCERCGGELATF